VPTRPSLNKTRKKPSPAKNKIAHHLGLHLTLGALILIGAAWLFGIVVEDVVNNESMTVIDLQVAAYLYARATPLLTIVMTFISYFGAPAVTGSMAFATGIVLWRRRYSYRLLELVIAVPGGMLFNVLIKYIIHRPRPFFDNPLLTLTGYSFPSGHAMASTVLYGMLAAFAVRTSTDWQRRVVAVFMALSLIALVCFSLIYLGVHYLSDVLAGIAEGVAWLALCLTAVDMLERHHAARRYAL
jgi:membrane-associated phospholipid phosphatase